MSLKPYNGGRVPRRPKDLYPTHPAGVEALIRAESARMREWDTSVWEPACGPGMLARVLDAHGFYIVASDLVDHGYGRGGVDFLAPRMPPTRLLVTNPPYNLAGEFVSHAVLRLRVPYVAMLLKSTFWHAASRADLYRTCPPSVIYPLGWRLPWDSRGAPVEEHIWSVWDRNRPARDGAVYMPSLPRPDRWPEVGWESWMAIHEVTS